MVAADYQQEGGDRDEASAAGTGTLRRLVSAYDRWVARRQAVRQLYLLDRQAQKDLGIDRSEFNSIVFGDAAGRRRPNTRH